MIRTIRKFSAQKIVSLVSLPVNLGQPLLGPDRTPKLLREHGLQEILISCGWRVNNIPEIKLSSAAAATGELPSKSRANNIALIGPACQLIYNQGLQYAQSDDFLLIIGGDHSIPIGTITAIREQRKSTGIIWVDAHADINTPTTSTSGNMHGMPVGFLMGLVPNVRQLPGMSWFPESPVISPSDIVYIGLRDLDDGEKQYIRQLGIKAYTMYDIDRIGIGKVMDETIEYLRGFEGLHLSYDIDALDPFIAPHTGTSVRGGLSYREGNFICEALYATGRLRSMELVEVNPSLYQDVDPKLTISTALSIISSGMGRTIL